MKNMNLEGKLLGNRYEMVEKVGNGGMSTVYKAVDKVLKRNVAVKISENFTMSNVNDNEENIELQERITLIKNIGYFVYTWHRRIIICTALTAVVGMFAIAFLGEWYNTKLIALGGFLGVAVIIILIALLHIFYRKQFLIECENGKIILVIGGFRRFRKYYVNNRCYKN